MAKINEYPIESFQLNDDDFLDIDFFDVNSSTYQTRKIKGIAVKQSVDVFVKSTLGAVAISNDYNDLDNLPVIPTPISNHSQLVLDDGTNPHGTTKSDVGLSNVDNTSDLNKPISTATQNALDLKQDELISGVNIKTIGGNSILGSGNIDFPIVGVNQSSTQWSKIIPSPVTLNNTKTANGFTFFVDTDKVANGTTPYDEYDIAFGISIVMDVSNTNGTANINILGVDYPMTFVTNNFTTISNWFNSNQSTLNALNVRVFRLGGSADGRLRFCATESVLNGITFTNLSGNLNATRKNEFTGSLNAVNDHVLVPYVGTPYEGQRLHHTFRVNFGIATGSTQTYALSLRRFENDSIIESEIPIQRNQDVEGVQVTFASYTGGPLDPFVVGGFYFALRNDSGQNLNFINNIGILLQNEYQQPTNF